MLLQGSSGLKLCRAVARNAQVYRLVQTNVVRKSAAKTPIQEFGWDYLMRQRAMKRPISPHLTVYKPQLTWMVSGFHRMTGCAMAGALLIGGLGFALLPLNFTTFIDFTRGLNIPWFVTDALKFVIAYPIAFHTLNGIRFIAFDLALGTDIVSVYRTGYLVLGLAALIALATVVLPRIQQQKKDSENLKVVESPKKQ